jgi:hypothetical protein
MIIPQSMQVFRGKEMPLGRLARIRHSKGQT